MPMGISIRCRRYQVVALLSGLALAACISPALAQGNVGQKGGQQPAPPVVQGGANQGGQGQVVGLAGGVKGGGAAINQGIGQTVSRLAKSGIHGQQLAAIIHQMKGNRGKGGQGGKPAGVGGKPAQKGGG